MKIYLSNGALLISTFYAQFARSFPLYLEAVSLFATILLRIYVTRERTILRTKWTVRKVNESHDEGSLAMKDKIASYKMFPGTHGLGRLGTHNRGNFVSAALSGQRSPASSGTGSFMPETYGKETERGTDIYFYIKQIIINFLQT